MKKHLHNKVIVVWGSIAAAVLAVSFGTGPVEAAVTVGNIAPDFNVRNHSTLQNLRLYNYRGSIIVLDFWAYWCGPCMSAASDIEPNIVEYYRNNGGNVNGVPVQLISVSVDMSDPAAENSYIQTYGLELVGDDTTGAAYSTYGNGYIPYLLVINGTTNSTNYRAWEVLYSAAGYSSGVTVPNMKAKINAVQTATPAAALTAPAPGAFVPPGAVSITAVVNNMGKIIKKVEFYDGATFIGFATNTSLSVVKTNFSLSWLNAPAGAKSVTARAYYGTSSKVDSSAVSFTVGVPTPIEAKLVKEGGNIVLSWNGSPGVFRVQMSTNLDGDNWQYVTTAATNTSYVAAPGNSKAFYRIVRP